MLPLRKDCRMCGGTGFVTLDDEDGNVDGCTYCASPSDFASMKAYTDLCMRTLAQTMRGPGQ